MKSFLLWIIITSTLLKLILSAISYHSDIQAFDTARLVITSGHIGDFYDYLYSLPDTDPLKITHPPILFNYPPAVYFTLGTLTGLTTFLVDQNFHQLFLIHPDQAMGDIRTNIILLLLKLPYFIFDFGVAYLLWRIFPETRQKRWVLILWLFNPINLYATYMMGQFDVIPVFWTTLSLYLVYRKPITFQSLCFAALSLGIGMAFKIYPLLLIIPLAVQAKSLTQRILLICLGFAPYILFLMPFIASKGYRMNALLANQTTKSLYSQIPVSGGEAIILFVTAVCFCYFIFWYRQELLVKLWQRFFLMLIIFFIFTHFHPQWLLWLTPFLIFDLVYDFGKHWLLVALIHLIFIAMLFFFDAGLTTNLFSPLLPHLFKLGTVWEVYGLNPDINFIRSILQSIFVSIGMYYIYYYFSRRLHE
jgi:hypothetical protein